MNQEGVKSSFCHFSSGLGLPRLGGSIPLAAKPMGGEKSGRMKI
jgi:hypothetical protein